MKWSSLDTRGSCGHGDRSSSQCRSDRVTRLNGLHPSLVHASSTGLPASTYMLAYTVGAPSAPHP